VSENSRSEADVRSFRAVLDKGSKPVTGYDPDRDKRPVTVTTDETFCRKLWLEISKLFDAICLKTPSVRAVAEQLAFAPDGLAVGELAERTRFSKRTIWKAARRLSGLHIGGLKICQATFLDHRGRGYQTTFRCEAFSLPMQTISVNTSRTLKTLESKTNMTDNRGWPANRSIAQNPLQNTENQKAERPKSVEERRKLLFSLSEDVVLVKGSRFYRYAMEYLRLRLWRIGARRDVGEVICSTVSAKTVGRSLSEFWRYVRVIEQAGVIVIRRVEAGIAHGGLPGGFEAAHGCFNRILSGGRLVDDRGFDLTDSGECKRFIEVAKGIDEGKCPRCAGLIWPESLEEPGRAFDPYESEELCRCLYIAVSRSSGAKREPAKSPERRKPPALGRSPERQGESRQPERRASVRFAGRSEGGRRGIEDAAYWRRLRQERVEREVEEWARARDDAAARGQVLNYAEWQRAREYGVSGVCGAILAGVRA